ncbi:MAG: DUF695 domain-containing protein [Campylobacterota bacterium]|nr:DUF695 domain-containing protein [Campylobacterota bacterium]
MREIFQRLEDGENIHYEVEMDAGEFKSENPWLFSVFVKFDSCDENSDGFEEFLETKGSLIIALESEGEVHYVGSRVVDGWSEFYFYASDSKELNSMSTAILKESGYTYESNVVKDKKWNFYETQLFPTELEQHNIQTAKIIFLLEEEGDDLSLARDVEHYVSFEVPTQKNRFINTLNVEGFSFKDDISSDEFEHGVALVKNHAVTYEEATKVIAELFEFIKKEHGYYEGWSTTLVNSDD